MSDTPETDAFVSRCSCKNRRITDDFSKRELAHFARKLERERNAAKDYIAALEEVCDSDQLARAQASITL